MILLLLQLVVHWLTGSAPTAASPAPSRLAAASPLAPAPETLRGWVGLLAMPLNRAALLAPSQLERPAPARQAAARPAG